jgi:hypothetical protein
MNRREILPGLAAPAALIGSAEGPRAAPAHEGTMIATGGHWSIHAVKGLANDDDGGSYEVRDTTAVITGKLGTGYWKRSVQ